MPNGFGVYDMHGNASEWVLDSYEKYKTGLQTNPRGPTNTAIQIARGGSWMDFAKSVRSGSRNVHTPDPRDDFSPPLYHSPDIGFRLARQLSKTNPLTGHTSSTCITIGRKIPQRITLKVGMRFCDAGGRNEAQVIKIANRLVVFRDNGKRKTCAQGRSLRL